jgi:hypothetical protein
VTAEGIDLITLRAKETLCEALSDLPLDYFSPNKTNFS